MREPNDIKGPLIFPLPTGNAIASLWYEACQVCQSLVKHKPQLYNQFAPPRSHHDRMFPRQSSLVSRDEYHECVAITRRLSARWVEFVLCVTAYLTLYPLKLVNIHLGSW